MSIFDLYGLMEPLTLNPSVPDELRFQYDKARHAFIYSWFAYDLVSLAEQQGYQTVEMALRHKLPQHERQMADTEHWGLGKLMKRAFAHQWLSRDAFTVPAPWAKTGKICHLDVFVDFRNELAHGSQNLFPDGSLAMLRLAAGV